MGTTCFFQGRGLCIILKQSSGPCRQDKEGSPEYEDSRLFKCINPDNPIHLDQASDLGVADLWRLSLQPPLELSSQNKS